MQADPVCDIAAAGVCISAVFVKRELERNVESNE